MQYSQVVAAARKADGRSSWNLGEHLSLCHLWAPPCGLSMQTILGLLSV